MAVLMKEKISIRILLSLTQRMNEVMGMLNADQWAAQQAAGT